MMRLLKYLGLTIAGFAALCYLAFLFVLPNAVDLDKFKPEVQKLVNEQANLNVDFENLKITTTPLLGAGVKVDNIVVKLPDNTVLFSADNFKTRLSLPSLLLLTVKVSCCELNNPFINLEIINDENFKVAKLVEDILNANKEELLEEKKVEVVDEIAAEEGFSFDPSWIRIKVPCVKLNNYKILINDLKSKHYLTLKGEELRLAYLNGKVAKVKTNAEFYSDENKNITADIDINTFLPAIEPSLDEEDDPATKIEIPFVNPVTMYRNYDLKANLDAKLKIRENNMHEISSYGHLNVENITLKIGHIQLPESYLIAKTFGQNVDLDTNIYPTPNENIELLGKLKYGKNPNLNMNIKTSKIEFNNLLVLTKALLDSLHIKHELNQVKAEGYFIGDCYIKTNFKKLTSNGKFNIKNGGVSVRNLGKVLSKTNINVILDNNVLDIVDSSLYVGNSRVDLQGKIDEKSIADITVDAKKVSLPLLFNAFAPQNVRNVYNFKSADLSVNLGVNGKLKEAKATAKVDLDNLNLSDRQRTFVIANNKLNLEFLLNKENLIGNIKNNALSVALPQTKSRIVIPNFDMELAENNISIKENEILLNDNSKLKYHGLVTNYNKLDNIDFVVEGGISTQDLIKLIGQELKMYIHSNGVVPVKATVDGNGKKQTLFLQALCDNDNFITPIDIAEIQGLNTALQAVIDFKQNRIKIKKTGLFTRNVSVDEEGNEKITLSEILGVDGTIEGDRINLLKITLPKELNGKIYVFPRSKFTVSGKAFVLGELAAPRLRGGFNIREVAIPELLLTLRSANLQFKGHEANFDVQDLLLNGSDIQANGIFSILPSSIFHIINLNVNSRYINVDKLMAVVDKSMAYVPATPSGTTTSSSAPAVIPVRIHNGSINFSRIISGAIDIKNTYSRISMARNVFFLRNLHTNIFDGDVSGRISMDLITTLLNVKVSGQNVDVDKMLVQAAGMKDMLSGKAKFDAELSLRGATYEEQVKSLKGDINFDVRDGQFGPFGKLENLIIAENIRESQFFQTALGGVISGLTTIDTTHFSELIGSLSFEDGVCHIDPITSLGNILSLHIFGDFDILRNYADMKVRARMASLISNLLGPIGAINPANLLNSAASLNVFTAKAFSIFCEMVPESEIAILPSFSNKYVDNAATKFQLVVRGDAAKPLTLIKSFKWLATATEYQTAIDYVNSLPEPVEGSTASTIEEAIQEAQAIEAEKQTLKYKLRHIFDKDETVQKNNNNVEEVKQTEDVKDETTKPNVEEKASE